MTTRLHDSKSVHGATLDGYEITGGIQDTLYDNCTFGVAASYESDTLNYKGWGHGRSHTWLGGIYGLYRPEGYYVLADVAYGYSQNKVHRNIEIGTLSYKTTGKPNASQVTFYGEIGADWAYDCFLIQPFGGIEVGSYWRQQFTEKGASPWNLAIHKKNGTAVSSRLGVHLTMNEFYCTTLSLDLAWMKRLTSSKNTIHGHFTDFGDSFNTFGLHGNNNSFDGAFTASTRVCDGLTLYCEGAWEVWERLSSYSILGGIKYTW